MQKCIATGILDKVIIETNRPVAQIPQCISPISHDVAFCVHISATKWCIVRFLAGSIMALLIEAYVCHSASMN